MRIEMPKPSHSYFNPSFSFFLLTSNYKHEQWDKNYKVLGNYREDDESRRKKLPLIINY